MNTQSLIIPIHSFVDVITNSSSEIFVSADQNTVKAIKKLVDNIILASSSAEILDDNGKRVGPTADDLFTFELKYLCYDDSFDEVYLTKQEIKQKRKEIDEIIENADGKYSEEQVAGAEEWNFGDGDADGYTRCSVIVTVKDKSNKHAAAAAKILSDLTGLFNIDSTYN